MELPIRMWSGGGAQLDCLKLILERSDPHILRRSGDGFNLTILHSIAGARPHVTVEERLAFATALLDAGVNRSSRRPAQHHAAWLGLPLGPPGRVGETPA
jgi:hypothetical protein